VVLENDHRFVAVRIQHDLDGRTAASQRVAAGMAQLNSTRYGGSTVM